MAIFRVEKKRDYTVMSNHHLRSKTLSLKAKGLLSLILSLPNDWDFTLKGLAAISVEGIDSIRQGVNELETQGYIVRSRIRDDKGRLGGAEYIIYEHPVLNRAEPDNAPMETPAADRPADVPPALDAPISDYPAQAESTQLNTKEPSTDINQIPKQANPNPSNPTEQAAPGRMDRPDAAALRRQIHRQIGYDVLSEDTHIDTARLDEIVNLMLEIQCASGGEMTISGRKYDVAKIQECFRGLNSQHIQYIFECMDKSHTPIRNIKGYLLATMLNALSTMQAYYAAKAKEVTDTWLDDYDG